MNALNKSLIAALYALPVLTTVAPADIMYAFYRLPFIALVVLQLVILILLFRRLQRHRLLILTLPVIAIAAQAFHIVSIIGRCGQASGFCFA